MAVVLAAAAVWWLGRDPFAVIAAGSRAAARGGLARIMPATTPKFRKDTAAAFVQAPANRAVAVAPQGAKLRWTASWPSRDLAEEKALERCQQVYDEPCALIAVNDAIVPPGADGNWTPRDAPRVRYAGPFNIERIPGIRAPELQRSDIANYPAAAAPKAMAFNAGGVLSPVSGATSQRSAEEQALLACKGEALRQKLEGACYLYAVENRVVLPLRATGPISAAAVAAPPEPAPSEATVRARLLEGLARIVPPAGIGARVPGRRLPIVHPPQGDRRVSAVQHLAHLRSQQRGSRRGTHAGRLPGAPWFAVHTGRRGRSASAGGCRCLAQANAACRI